MRSQQRAISSQNCKRKFVDERRASGSRCLADHVGVCLRKRHTDEQPKANAHLYAKKNRQLENLRFWIVDEGQIPAQLKSAIRLFGQQNRASSPRSSDRQGLQIEAISRVLLLLAPRPHEP